jgi:indole-3-glycerol phosphate synthase
MNTKMPEGGFVKTDTILDKILAHKVIEVGERMSHTSLAQLSEQLATVRPPLDFVAALHRDTVALIAEVKKASPSKGVLIQDFDPAVIGKIYADNGAAAISVLADEHFFQGNLRYLDAVRQVVNVPILCKEFVVDPYQVYEARSHQADAVLLIVAALSDSQLADLHELIRELGMAALVEVHHEAEVERALKIGARLIGINNRDLKTFHEDLTITARLARLVPPDVTLVAESAIRTTDDLKRIGTYGAHAVLVGESLVKADNMASRVRDFSNQPREVKHDQSEDLRRNHV